MTKSEKNKEWKRNHPIAGIESGWRSRGIPCDYQQYVTLKEQQGDQCAICWEKKKLYVDHDHATGILRGLICQTCNLGLGQFYDSDRLLLRAAKYIEHHANKREIPANIV